MKYRNLLFFCFSFLAFFSYISADEVFLKNGTTLQGTVTKVNNNNTIDFMLRQNGEIYNIPYSDIFKVKYKTISKVGDTKNECLGNYKDGDAFITLKGKQSKEITILSEQKNKYLILDKKTRKVYSVSKNQVLKLEFKEKGLKKPSKNFFLVKSFLNEKVDVFLKQGEKMTGTISQNNCESFTLLGKRKKENKIYYSAISSIKSKEKEPLNKNLTHTWKRFIPGLYQLQTKSYISSISMGSLFFGSLAVTFNAYSTSMNYTNMKKSLQNQQNLILSRSSSNVNSSTTTSTDSTLNAQQTEYLLLDTLQTNQIKTLDTQIVRQISIMNYAVITALSGYVLNWIQTGNMLKQEKKKTTIAKNDESQNNYLEDDNTRFIFTYDIKNIPKDHYYSSSSYEHSYNIGYSYNF